MLFSHIYNNKGKVLTYLSLLRIIANLKKKKLLFPCLTLYFYSIILDL